jgi:alpha-glucosidase
MGGRVWWRDGVLYQVYPRSFADSDGDGVGDLRGIVHRLEHLAWLGIDGIWLNPTFPSPNADWGFDVADYRDVHPDLGTLADLDELVARAGERGIRVLLDLVPNHTSDEHAWFVEARGTRDAPHRDWYVWRDPGPAGGPPNNWKSIFGGPAWELDDASGQYYLHLFHRKQPDLDWWNDAVRDEFDAILAWWYDRGVAGFRIDVAHGIVKDRELRDNPQAREDDVAQYRRMGQRPEFSMLRPDVHDVLRRWRRLGDARDPEPILVGETWVHDLETLATFYGSGVDELHLAFNFVFLEATLDAPTLAPVVARTEELLPERAWPVWTLGNHDLTRFPSRWAGGDERKVRLALMLLLTLRGTPILYYGDEVGMPEADVPDDRVVDPIGLLRQHGRKGRDGARTPMPWSAAPGAGFTAPGVEPWLPFGDLSANVAEQRADPGSVLILVRDVIALRRSSEDLRSGAYAQLDAPEGAWAYRRGDATTVALNLSDAPVTIAGPRGRVAIGTDRARDGEAVDGALVLAPWEGAVVADRVVSRGRERRMSPAPL